MPSATSQRQTTNTYKNMAKYTITHKCGCERTYNIIGKHTERDRKIEWLETQECPECRRKAEDEAAKAATEGMELPELEGSVKQVAWANTIRAQFIKNIREFSEMVRGGKKYQLYFAKWIDESEAVNIVASIKEAKTFIDWREGAAALINHILDTKEQENAQKLAETTENAKAEEIPTEVQKTPKKGSEWGKVAINAQNVERTTEKAALINIPHRSDHDGYSLWVSLKLLRSGRHNYEYMLSAKSDMTFTLKKYGNGKWNKSQVIAEKTLSADELAAAFGGWVDDAPRYSKPAIDPDKEEIVKHVPAPLTPVEIDADPELVR